MQSVHKSDYDRNARLFLHFILYGAFILLMQYSKHKWIISHPGGLGEWTAILHAEGFIFFNVIFIFYLLPLRNFILLPLAAVYYYICYFDYVSWFEIDRPFHPNDIARAIELIIYYPEFLKGLNYKAIILPIVPAIVWSTICCREKIKFLSKLRVTKNMMIIGTAAIYLTAIPLIIKPNYFYYNSMIIICREMLYDSRIKNKNPNQNEIESLLGRKSRERLQSDREDCNAVDEAKYKNIIFFIIETAPFSDYPNLIEYLDQKGMHALTKNAIALDKHYSTYPESDRAILSILNGKYPPLERGPITIPKSRYIETLPKILKRKGYRTYFISTAPLDFHNNIEMIKNLGFDNILEVKKTKNAIKEINGKRIWEREKLYDADLSLLKMSLDVINDHSKHKQGRPLFLVLVPQSSHAPFQKPPNSTADDKDDVALIKANAYWQFELLHRIVKAVLDDSVNFDSLFLVVGDHGIRSKYESQQLFPSPELLNATTFHVPCWFLSTRHMGMVPHHQTTSHIDITPTILDLLCIPYDRSTFHGRAIAKHGQRYVFFLGGDYLPTSGFEYRDMYFMENRYKNIVLKNGVFDFRDVKKKLYSQGKPYLIALGGQRTESVNVKEKLTLIKSFLYQEYKPAAESP